MNSQNVFHVVEVEIDCPREIPVVSAAYVMEDSTNARLGSLIAACASVQSAQITASLNCNCVDMNARVELRPGLGAPNIHMTFVCAIVWIN